jgi:AraC family transcriptional regulator
MAGRSEGGRIRDPLPEPLLSSRMRAWDGVSVNLYRLGSRGNLASHSEHLVSLQLSDGSSLYQSRHGHASRRRMHVGDIIVTPAGAPKVWRRESEGTVLMIGLAPSFMESVIQRAIGTCEGDAGLVDNYGTRDPQIQSVAMSLLGELEAARPGNGMFAQALGSQLAIHLWRHYRSGRKGVAGPARMARHKLRHVTTHIEDNLAEDLRVEVLAAVAGMNRFHFAHAFREATGVPPHRYVIRCRLDRAKLLLRETALSLTGIAQEVGYGNLSNFSASFRKLTGITPTDYRRG